MTDTTTNSATTTVDDIISGALSGNVSDQIAATSNESAIVLSVSNNQIVVADKFITITPGATGGDGTYVYSYSGTLPEGMMFSPTTGSISGSPTNTGVFSIDLTVASGDSTQSEKITIVVVEPLSVTYTKLSFEISVDSSVTPTISGGSGARTFSIQPDLSSYGLSIDSTTGTISGKPVSSGTINAVVNVTDASGAYAFPITVVIGASLVITGTPPEGAVGNLYTFQFTTAGGNGNALTSTVDTRLLPPGISLNASSCTLSGTPTTTGEYAFVINVTDGSITVSKNVTLTINPQIVISASYPVGKVGVQYQYTPSVVCGLGSPKWALVSGSLPLGLKLSATDGSLSGVPTTVGSYTFVISASDNSGTSTLQVTINVINTGSNPTDVVNDYDPQITLLTSQWKQTANAYPNLSEEDYQALFAVMSRIILLTIEAPTQFALSNLWDLAVGYKTTLFMENMFFAPTIYTPQLTMTKVSAVYMAYRAATTSRVSAATLSNLNAVTHCVPMVIFLS